MVKLTPVSSAPPSNAPVGNGIGDGCTTYGAQYLMPHIGAFRDAFTPACNAHDKCYTTLGTSYGECDGNFRNDMRSACRSKFHPIFQPVEYTVCTRTADEYYAAVRLWATTNDPLPGFQSSALNRSKSMQYNVETDTCGTTPEATTLYSQGLINQINSVFQQFARRNPTVYEFFDAVNAGDIVNANTPWQSILITKAQQAAQKSPPPIGFVTSNGPSGDVTLVASPVLTGVAYQWRAMLDTGNFLWGGQSFVTVPGIHPTYSTTRSVAGYVKAINSKGDRNLAIINIAYVEQGSACRGRGETPSTEGTQKDFVESADSKTKKDGEGRPIDPCSEMP